MQLESARTLKEEMLDFVRGEKLFESREAFWWSQGAADGQHPEPVTSGIILGVTLGHGDYRLGVRTQNETPETWRTVDAICEKACGEVDVRPLGPVYAQCECGPLRYGISVGHPEGPDGTIGPFVVPRENGKLHLLSNNHVLAASNIGVRGDVITHPGKKDGGSPEEDRIGTLAWCERLEPHGVPNDLDAAACLLDEGLDVDLTVRGMPVSGPVDVTVPLEVEKVGKRTGPTTGHVIMADMEPVEIGGYGNNLGKIALRGQMEVRRPDGSPFSLPGDSGALVYEKGTGVAIGLLVGGSVRGGAHATLVTPLKRVLDRLSARLAT
ncbi:hypothetical protein [Streptomyces sp. NPDC050856]|uniref:hypothetical protein n=1 Tax=Streptomyces sp. NPDC050856 TaxID=3154939 RepID=UPI0033D14375